MEWNTVERAITTETDTKNQNKNEWACLVGLCQNINRNVPTKWRWAHGDTIAQFLYLVSDMPYSVDWLCVCVCVCACVMHMCMHVCVHALVQVCMLHGCGCACVCVISNHTPPPLVSTFQCAPCTILQQVSHTQSLQEHVSVSLWHHYSPVTMDTKNLKRNNLMQQLFYFTGIFFFRSWEVVGGWMVKGRCIHFILQLQGGSLNSKLVGESAVIERLWVRILAGVVKECSSPELTMCAYSYSVSVPPPCYRSGT